LSETFDFLELDPAPPEPVPWPAVDLSPDWLGPILESEAASELDQIRARQQNYLQKELDRIESYFSNYERELTQRQQRAQAPASIEKLGQRLAAARAEHERRRQDQIQRHEIQLIPHLDAVLLVAEPAWETTVSDLRERREHEHHGRFVARNRRWFVE
jgi:hypothetical protein